MLHALVTIAREEGPKALYQGISPALLRQATYGTIKIGVYHSLKRMVVENPKDEMLVVNVACGKLYLSHYPFVYFLCTDETLVVNVACGIVAGIVSSSIANPTDVLKVRMQANMVMDERTSMMRSFINIYKQEGVKGLWRGVVPTAQRAAIIAGVELPVYDFCKKYIIRFELLGDTMVTHFISSFFAGLAGAIFSTPVDVVKTRLMNQKRLKMPVQGGSSSTNPVIYKSSIDCIIQTVRHEGFMALYKGFVPSWVRLGPWNIIVSFVSFTCIVNFFPHFHCLKKLLL
ncbi:hypothetical protein FSP39_000954 [Pinctada imbricata]|uniref:Uncharacterized protein n=1 Tax=Pinctada imbricata TaxID=66713 RepID=A0AA88Y4Y0_PINIB|nr:hypothetical protein FSP39_000954 [Pinctada imbricata]